MRKFSFDSGQVCFAGLELTTILPKRRYFKNVGVFEDIEQKAREIVASLEQQTPTDLSGRANGLCLTFNLGEFRYACTLVRRTNPDNELFNQGHESVHALEWLGLSGTWANVLLERGYNFDPYNLGLSEEDRANLGGIVAYHGRYGFVEVPSKNNPRIPELSRMLIQCRK